MRATSSRGSRASWLGIGVFGALIVIAGLLVWFRQDIVDRVSASQYQPSTVIAGFADRTTMTRVGELYFYASHPSLEATQAFNTFCRRQEQGSAVLGCYASGRIYLYDIQNEDLDGIREVTAAHEMLHAAFDRLNSDDQNRIGALLEDAYKRQGANPELKERMDFYERTQPGDRITELHSILGTEAADVGDELEVHYKRYFTDRTAVVSLYNSYGSRFKELRDKIDVLSAELESLRQRIDRDTASYNSATAQLDADIDSFNARARSGAFLSQATFSRERAELVDRVAKVNAMRASVNEQIEQYESMRQEYNSVAYDAERLHESIDSSLAPSPSLQG